MTSHDINMTTHEPTMNHIGNPMDHMKHNDTAHETAQDTASNLMNRPMNHLEPHEPPHESPRNS